jgi:hypothetical protein
MTDAPNSMLVHCGPCRHEWMALKSPMPLDEAAEAIFKMQCPKCSATSDRIYCGSVINTSAERVKKTGES